MRRARVAYGAGPLFHYLHPLGHEYRTGVVTYTTVTGPATPDDRLWQTNADTADDGRTLFDYVSQWLAGNRAASKSFRLGQGRGE
jgi:hypothetical protein